MIDLPATMDSNDCALALEASSTAVADGGSYVFRDEAILGTRMDIQLIARNYADAQAAAIAARAEIDRLNAILNSRDPASELALLNRVPVHRASPELFAVVEAAERWRLESAGAFSGRLGRAIDVWQSVATTPSRAALARLAHDADRACVELDAATRTIVRPDAVEFALDAIAKGWIVDRAFDAASASPGVFGALINIGGDIRCGGQAPSAQGWCVGIPDGRAAVDNAPLAGIAHIANGAIATSGRGPRDRMVEGVRYSPTLSPHDGWPVQHAMSVTALATTAMAADASATAMLSMPQASAIEWAADRNIAAQIVTDKDVLSTVAARGNARITRLAAAEPQIEKADKKKIDQRKVDAPWPKDWVALVVFTAPPRQLARDQHFRSPYVAMWITDLDNNPVRTLLLVGRHLDWQEDNFIWWSLNRDNVKQLSMTRSMSTSGAGVYKMLWDGTDDQFRPLPAGKYVLHVETSRERGKHTHRSLTLDFSKGKSFSEEIPTSEEAGGLTIEFYRQ